MRERRERYVFRQLNTPFVAGHAKQARPTQFVHTCPRSGASESLHKVFFGLFAGLEFNREHLPTALIRHSRDESLHVLVVDMRPVRLDIAGEFGELNCLFELYIMTTHKEITVTNVGDIAHVRFIHRRITDPDVIHGLGEELLTLYEKEDRHTILLDFSDVGFLSSAAIGKLIKLNNRMQSGKGQLRLAAIRPEIFEVFRLLKLDETFHIHDTVDDAMQSF